MIHNLRLRVPNKYRVEKSVITAARDIFSDRGSRMPLSDNGFLELPPDAIDDLTRTQETHGYTNAAHCFRMNILAYLFAALAENAGDEQEQHQSLLNYRKAIRGKHYCIETTLHIIMLMTVYLEIAVFGKTHATYISRGGKALLRIAGSLGPLVLLCPEHLKWLQLGYVSYPCHHFQRAYDNTELFFTLLWFLPTCQSVLLTKLTRLLPTLTLSSAIYHAKTR